MNTYLRHLNTFRDTYDTPRDYPWPWALVYVPEGFEISPNLYENYVILCDRMQRSCYLLIENHEYFGTLEELEPVLMAWLYVHDIEQNGSTPPLKENLQCTA